MGSDMSIGNLQNGCYTVMGAGSTATVKTSEGALLGFLGTVAGTATIYDNTSAAAPNMVTALPIAVGWNPIPLAFATGCTIALTTAAGTAVWV